MKFAIALALLVSTIGCASGQLPIKPVLTCPSAGTAGNYAALNASTPTISLTYTDSGLASGTSWCYVVQWLPTGAASGGTSGPSNIVGPLVAPSTTATHSMDFSWNAPGTGGTYVMSRVAAISAVPTAPALGTNPTIATLDQMQLRAVVR